MTEPFNKTTEPYTSWKVWLLDFPPTFSVVSWLRRYPRWSDGDQPIPESVWRARSPLPGAAAITALVAFVVMLILWRLRYA